MNKLIFSLIIFNYSILIGQNRVIYDLHKIHSSPKKVSISDKYANEIERIDFTFDSKGNWTSNFLKEDNVIEKKNENPTFFKEGHFKGLIYSQKVKFKDSLNNVKKIVTYRAILDTLELGIIQINSGKKLDSEFIEYTLEKLEEVYYDNKGLINKVLGFGWTNRCYTYHYNSNNDIIKEKEYRIHTTCCEYHSDCSENIKDCKEVYLHKFNNYIIPDKIWFNQTSYEYIYDDKGNWIVKKVFDHFDGKTLTRIIKRKIKY